MQFLMLKVLGGLLNLFVLCALQSMGPQFLMNQNCTANFKWETRAACSIKTTKNNVSSNY